MMSNSLFSLKVKQFGFICMASLTMENVSKQLYKNIKILNKVFVLKLKNKLILIPNEQSRGDSTEKKSLETI